jgi:hypothetical protein
MRRSMRSPHIGETVKAADGVEETIMSFELRQPGAPKFFQVDTKSGRVLFITFRGLGWIEYQDKKILDGRSAAGAESVVVAADRPQVINPAPSSDLSSGVEGHAAAPSANASAERIEAGGRREAHRVEDAAPYPIGSRYQSRPAQSISRAEQFRGGHHETAVANAIHDAREGIETKEVVRRKPRAEKPRRHEALQARLDKAREAFSRVRENPDGVAAEEYLRVQSVYCDLVAELDRVDPTFYGPLRSDEPIQIGFGSEMPMSPMSRNPTRATWRGGLTSEQIDRRLAYARKASLERTAARKEEAA